MNWILLPFWNSSIWNFVQPYILWNAWSSSLLDFLSKDPFKKAQCGKHLSKKCFCKGNILKGLESLCMLKYPVVNIIAFSCKITIRKIFFISQLFFSLFCKNRLLFSCLHWTCTGCIRNSAQEKKKGRLPCRSNSRKYSSSLWLELINVKKA